MQRTRITTMIPVTILFFFLSLKLNIFFSSPCFYPFCPKTRILLPADLRRVPNLRILYSQVVFIIHVFLPESKSLACAFRINSIFFIRMTELSFSFLSYRIPGFHSLFFLSRIPGFRSLFVSVRTISRRKPYAHPW